MFVNNRSEYLLLLHKRNLHVFQYFGPLFCEFRPQKTFVCFVFFLSSHFFETKAKHVLNVFTHVVCAGNSHKAPQERKGFQPSPAKLLTRLRCKMCSHTIWILFSLHLQNSWLVWKKYPGVVLRQDVLTSRYYLQVAVHWPFASRPPAETSSGHRKGAWRGTFLCPRFIGISANSIRTFHH